MAGDGATDPKVIAATEKNFEHDIGLFHDASIYPNFRSDELKGTVREQATAIVKNLTSNLVFLYNQASDEVKHAGSIWYESAHKVGEKATADSVNADFPKGLPQIGVFGTIAILSPNKEWDQNVDMARRVVDTYATKQHYQFDEAMRAQFAKTWDANKAGSSGKPDPDSQKYKDKVKLFESYRRDVEGKKLGELSSPLLKAVWIRTYDEAHNPQTYHTFLPNGDIGPLARNLPNRKFPEGAPTTMVWQSTKFVANAVRCLESNGDRQIISDNMGGNHKVRSFFNNILDPHSPNQDTTIDTHQVGAALLRGLGAKSAPVTQNFGLAPPKGVEAASGSEVTGLSGTYGVYADATRAAAKETGVPYAQVMQAITWVTKRNVLGETSDAANALIEKAWGRYHDGRLTQPQTQKLVWNIAMQDVARQAVARKTKLDWDLAAPARVAARAVARAQTDSDKAARATARAKKKVKSATQAKKVKLLL
jgi:hypothetical protein